MFTPIINTTQERDVSHQHHDRPVIYLAEDEADIRESLAALLMHEGFTVRAARDGTQLFDWLFRSRGRGVRLPDVIITDHRMPGYTSLDILDCLAEVQLTIPVLVLTGFGPEIRGLAKAHGAIEVFDKPFDPDELRDAAMTCINWDVRRLRDDSTPAPGTRWTA